MKRLMFLVVVLALVAIPSTALAEGGGAETGHHSSEFLWVQDYFGWGPACYYEQDVHVVYSAINTWTYVVQGGNVRETLVQNGTAEIYDMGGNLLDERAFHVTERFFDAGIDVALKHDYGTSVWYQASHNWWNSDLEEYQYIWKIPGVYDYRVLNRGGYWSYGWTSGDCEEGWPGGWPPHPPHP